MRDRARRSRHNEHPFASAKSMPLNAAADYVKGHPMSVAFLKEESAETASETLLPPREISPHANLVTETGLKALETALADARAAWQAAQDIEDVNERRRQQAIPLRDIRYYSERIASAQLMPPPSGACSTNCHCAPFGSYAAHSQTPSARLTSVVTNAIQRAPLADRNSAMTPAISGSATRMERIGTPLIVPTRRPSWPRRSGQAA